MTATIIISLLIFISIILSIIFFPKIKIKNITINTYWVIALLGALIFIINKLVPIENIITNLTIKQEINPIKILILFISMTFISIVLDELGLFKYIAINCCKRAKNNQFSIFITLYVITAVLTIFTSNDIVILTLTPFICFLCKNLKVNPIPYLIAEFMAANTYSMMLIIGNPTNIYLATSLSISFIDYFKVMALPTISAGLVEIILIILFFRSSLTKPIDKIDENYQIEDKISLIVSLIHLIICLIFLVISNMIHIQMWLISFITMISLFIWLIINQIRKKNHDRFIIKTIKRLPFELIPFILSMFVIITTLEYQGITTYLVNLLNKGKTIFSFGLSSYLVSNLINNIPMSILYANLITKLNTSVALIATYAAIIGSNIGAFLTPIGALAGIMFTTLTHKYDTLLDFKTFTKYGIIISLPVIVVSLIVLSLIL